MLFGRKTLAAIITKIAVMRTFTLMLCKTNETLLECNSMEKIKNSLKTLNYGLTKQK